MNSWPVLDIQGIAYRYDDSTPLLEQVDVTINAGERVVLLGRSGSGKSTLLQLIAGLLQSRVGQIRLGAVQLELLREPELTRLRRDKIGFVYQQFLLLPTLTLSENVALPLELAGVGRADAMRQARARLQQLGVEQLANRFPDQVSGGEQQRAGIARALVTSPDLILADEPTGSLDAKNAEQVLDALFDLTRQESRCVLVATHSAAVAARADRVLTVHQGKLVPGALADELAW